VIRFDNWLIHADGEIIARQFDHLTRTLTVIGDLPKGWEWTMIVTADGNMDYLPLKAVEGGAGIALSAEQLSIAGYYTMQLRGTKGELVKHTNQVSVYIPATLSGDKQWPKLPSEFSDMERRVNDATQRSEQAAAAAQGYTSHPPVIGENGNWMEWNGEAYVDTGKPSRGEDAATKIVATHDGNGNVVLSTESGQAITAAHDGEGNVVLSIGG